MSTEGPDASPRRTEDANPPAPLVACVILHFNRPQDTLACVTSLHASRNARLLIIVLDGGPPGDPALAVVRDSYPSIDIVCLPTNLGYAGNNNIGIDHALSRGAEWVFLLNDDTVVAPDAVAQLVEAGKSDSRVGIVGPTVYHFDEPSIIQSAGGAVTAGWDAVHHGQNEVERGQFPTQRLVSWISGCALMVRRELIAEVGMLDERFFLYWEEVEWCLRAGRAGWHVMHAPTAHVWHKGVRRDYRPGPAVTYYSTRNHLLMLAALGAPRSARLMILARMMRTLVSSTVRPRWRSKRAHRDAMWQGVMDYWRGRFGGWRQ